MLEHFRKFLREKQKEVQAFCVTCRRDGFHETKCNTCDLYTLALGVDFAAWIEEKEDAAEIRACADCDKVLDPINLNEAREFLEDVESFVSRTKQRIEDLED